MIENKHGSGEASDPTKAMAGPDVLTPVNANLMYNPNMQYIGGRGTTVYNKRPSHPDMEARYGERRYKQKPKENDPREQRSQIDRLEQQVAMLTNLLAGKVGETTETASGDTGVEDTPEESPYESRSYAELLKEAKAKDPELKGRPSKNKVIEILEA